MIGNYLPSGPDIEIDDSQYTYGLEKTQPSESESQTTELDTCNSNISTEPSELVSEPVVNESNIEVQPKVWSDAPIIEEYESDSDDEYVSVQTKGLDTPSFANKQDNPHRTLKNKGIIDSGCSRHMTGNKAYLADFQDFNGGPVAFGGSKGYITNKVLFTDSECLVLSPDFKLPDENQILLKVPRQNNMYSFNLENIVPLGGLACLIAKATTDESNKWHRRLGQEAEALRKNVEQETENLVTQQELLKDDFEISPLEDIHEDTTYGIFTHSSYDDEGAEADFTNLETVVNVWINKKSQENSKKRASTDTRIRRVQKPKAKPATSSLSQIQSIYGQ
ncbi:hypothetical protein Tco_0680788 [Tanacetum coccineum]|uniref:Retrovirus-related Pol polyprotein from transposon TNT 1-94-like beta-barrel domain-containing protein n=1 Tax=Tanacetum coccineum TaxID=301880 RepID=A0ABQ4XLS5_9ASTR